MTTFALTFMKRFMTPNIVLNNNFFSLDTPVVMAIINVTPDSFYAHVQMPNHLLQCVDVALKEGASIIDIGGCSTRPDSTPASEQEELSRISAALNIIRKHYPDILISIDTYRGNVAREAVTKYNCSIINDISAFSLDDNFLQEIIELQHPYILSHYPSEILNDETPDDKFLSSVLQFFSKKIRLLRDSGFNGDIIIDPGFGFKKTIRQNYLLLNNLHLLKAFNCPILAGLSRKSMLYKPLDLTPADVLPATIAANTIALQQGASILRVHDVAPAIQTIKTTNFL